MKKINSINYGGKVIGTGLMCILIVPRFITAVASVWVYNLLYEKKINSALKNI